VCAALTWMPSGQLKWLAAPGKCSCASWAAKAKRGLPRIASASLFTASSSARPGEPLAGGGGTSSRLSGSCAGVR
jgi:hypothetical protein